MLSECRLPGFLASHRFLPSIHIGAGVSSSLTASYLSSSSFFNPNFLHAAVAFAARSPCFRLFRRLSFRCQSSTTPSTTPLSSPAKGRSINLKYLREMISLGLCALTVERLDIRIQNGGIHIHFFRSAVGCLIEHENKVLVCKRKIEPSYGLWTLPAGFMEMGYSAIEGAIRETWDEAGAKVEVLYLTGHPSHWTNLHNFLGKAEGLALFTWARVTGMQALCSF